MRSSADGTMGREGICFPLAPVPRGRRAHEQRERGADRATHRALRHGGAGDRGRLPLALMARARRRARECWAPQRQGELPVSPPFEGQEAAQVGSAFALGAEDFAFPSFRELAAAIVRGVDAVEYLRYHRGTWHGAPYDPSAHGFAPICVPLATQLPHAAGWA